MLALIDLLFSSYSEALEIKQNVHFRVHFRFRPVHTAL